MSYFSRDLGKIIEVQLSVSGSDDSGGIQEGDIIATRNELRRCGREEMSSYLFILVTAAEEDDLLYLQSGDDFFRRRFCAPFHKLQAYFPALNLSRVRDKNDIYQPFVEVNPTDGSFTWRTDRLMSAFDVIVDKKDRLNLRRNEFNPKVPQIV